MTTEQRPKKRAGRPRRLMPARPHTLYCSDDSWAWFKDLATRKGHAHPGKWIDARGETVLVKRSQAERFKHGHPTNFERATDGTNYGRSIQAVRERFGLNTAELGKELGVAKRTIEGWEGGRMPSKAMIEVLRKLATRNRPLDDDTPVAPVPPPVLKPSEERRIAREQGAPPVNPLAALEELISQPEPAELEIQAQQS